MASRSRCSSRIFDTDLSPKAGGEAVTPSGLPSALMSPALRVGITHLPVVARRVELTDHDAAEGDQRPLTLLVGQEIPELVEPRRPDDGRARGGAVTAAARDMVDLPGPPGDGRGSIPPDAASRRARLWACPQGPVKEPGWG